MSARNLLAAACLAFANLCFLPQAGATIIVGDWFANLDTVELRGGGTRVDLYTAGGRLGNALGGDVLGGGLVRNWGELGGATSRIPPLALWWATDEATGRPVDALTRVLSFLFDDSGDFMGISPQPFLFAMGYPPDPISPVGGISPSPFRDPMGFLDFGGVSDVSLGSLDNITGLQLIGIDGTVDTFAPFRIRDIPGTRPVPEPAPLALLAIGLVGLLASRGPGRRQRPALAC